MQRRWAVGRSSPVTLPLLQGHDIEQSVSVLCIIGTIYSRTLMSAMASLNNAEVPQSLFNQY